MESYLNSCLDFAKKCSINNVFCILRLWNVGGLENENQKILDTIASRFTDNWQKTERGYRIADRVFIEWDSHFHWPDLNNDIYEENRYCLGAKDQIGILADGTVVPCCLDSDGIINLGNIFDADFEDIYNSERYQKIITQFRQRKACEELCKHCGYSKRF